MIWRPLAARAVLARVAFAAFLGFGLLAGGCKPKPGGSCSGNVAACIDKTSALFCIEGAYTPLTCRGDKGCAQTGAAVDCDESVANEQEACNAPDAIACTPDHKEALRCTKGHFVLDETCKGPTGCRIDATQKISCDNDIADVNDPCHFLGDYACTTDKSLVLKCEANKMTPLNTCRGPKQCKIIQIPKQDRVEFQCDDSVALEGDACDTNGEEACTMDKKGMFVCRGNKFGSQKPCPGGCLYEEKTDRYTCVDGSASADAGPAPSSSAVPSSSASAPSPPGRRHPGRH